MLKVPVRNTRGKTVLVTVPVAPHVCGDCHGGGMKRKYPVGFTAPDAPELRPCVECAGTGLSVAAPVGFAPTTGAFA
jgi:hypothetical protein